LLDAGRQSVLWSAGAPALGDEEMAAVITLAGAAAGLVALADPADELADVLVTSAEAFHVLRLVGDGSTQVAYLMLRRAGANLAMARQEFKHLIEAEARRERPRHLADAEQRPATALALAAPVLAGPVPAGPVPVEPVAFEPAGFEAAGFEAAGFEAAEFEPAPVPVATDWIASVSGSLEAFPGPSAEPLPEEPSREPLPEEPAPELLVEGPAPELLVEGPAPELLLEEPSPEQAVLEPAPVLPERESVLPEREPVLMPARMVLVPDQHLPESATALLPELGLNRRPEFGTDLGPNLGPEFGLESAPEFVTTNFGPHLLPEIDADLDLDLAALPRRRPNGAPTAATGSPTGNIGTGNEQGTDHDGDAGLPPLPDWLTVLGQPYQNDEGVLDRILVSLRHL
jgi:hypothetical protein